MKKLKIWIVLWLASTLGYAQTPELINYQLVVRDASGHVLANQSVGVSLEVLQGSSTGQSVYTETHTLQTNAFGLVNMQLGGGTSSGNLSDVDWNGSEW